MNESEINQFCEVISLAETYPLSSIFIDPITPDSGIDPEYFKIIKVPMDLTTLQNNLKSGVYSSPTDFDNDAELIWTNAEKFYGKMSFLGIVASEMRKIFNKCKRKVMVKTVNGFYEAVMRLNNKIKDEILNETITSGNDELLLLKKDTKNITQQLISENDMFNFMNAFEMITDEEDLKRINEIIKEKQPELLIKTNVVPLTNLYPSTFKALKSFLKDALKKKNLDYQE